MKQANVKESKMKHVNVEQSMHAGEARLSDLSMFWEAVEARTLSAKSTPDHVQTGDRTAFSFADFTDELSLARYLPYTASTVYKSSSVVAIYF